MDEEEAQLEAMVAEAEAAIAAKPEARSWASDQEGCEERAVKRGLCIEGCLKLF